MSPGRAPLAATIAGALLAAPCAGQQLSFVALGHTRGGPGNGVIPRERMLEAIAAVEALAPDFVVLTGDLIYGDIDAGERPVDRAALVRDWDAVDALLARLSMPVHRVPGNHDVWEATTREVWIERYGSLYSAFEVQGCRMILLCSPWLPPEGSQWRLPGEYIRGAPLPAEQLDFLRAQLEQAKDAPHAFVFLHHMLWWDPLPLQAAGDRERAGTWTWEESVLPLLRGTPVRAVLAGDFGPWKFSRAQLGGIEHLQTSVEFTEVPLVMLRNREASRSLSAQLDTFLEVRVDGPQLRYVVHTLGATTTQKHTPELYHAVHSHDAGTLRRKLFNRLGTPKRLQKGLLQLGAAAAAGGAALGLLAGWLLARRRRGG